MIGIQKYFVSCNLEILRDTWSTSAELDSYKEDHPLYHLVVKSEVQMPF